jgi:flagellar motor switch protein FliG
MDKRNLERSLRAAGREIAAAALAGCPQESLDLARPFYGKIGASALEDDVAHLRARLSGDEIAQAQTAFLEVLRNLEERGELRLGPEDELTADPGFVAALTKAILGVDAAILRGAFRTAQGSLIATAMQGMEPEAHDHILEALSKKEIKRILNAIDAADPLPRRVVQSAGKQLSQLLFEAAATARAPRQVLERLAAARDWEG